MIYVLAHSHWRLLYAYILLVCVQLPLYTPMVIEQYRSRGSKELAPHIYTIADDAYNNMIDNSQSQSIVISGESGAGM